MVSTSSGLGAGDPHAGGHARFEEAGGEAPGGVGGDAQPVGPVVHQVADGAEVALGGQPALGDDEDARAEALHLVEHVARHDDAAPGPRRRAGGRGR